MAAINQDAEPDAPGAAEIEEAVHGGANGAAGIQDVVDDHQIAVVYREIDFVECTTGCGPTVERSSR